MSPCPQPSSRISTKEILLWLREMKNVFVFFFLEESLLLSKRLN